MTDTHTAPEPIGAPVSGGFSSPYALIQAAYGGLIAPYTAELSDIPGLKLHLSLMLRRTIRGLLKQQTPLLVDVMTAKANALHALRNEVLTHHRRDAREVEAGANSHVDMIMMGAYAVSANHLGKTSLPVSSVLWWDHPISWADYLKATCTVRQGMLTAVMYRFNPGKPHASTLVVEAHTDLGSCIRSLDPREADGWYTDWAGILAPTATVPASTISVRLPAKFFCEQYA